MRVSRSLEMVRCLFRLPFFDLLHRAHGVHRKNFPPNVLQVSTLLSIKTGGCSEDCAYCSQSIHHKRKIPTTSLMSLEMVVEKAKRAKEAGASRLCMGASGRNPSKKSLEEVCEMIRRVKEIGLETCVTLGLLDQRQVNRLKQAGLDYYNHNVDTSPTYYKKIITTHTFEDRLQTLRHVRKAGIKVCCGGILGMGESNEDRLQMLVLLANLPKAPETIPINKLIAMPGTPLEKVKEMDSFDFVRIIALTRILMPKSSIRLSAGRKTMSRELQALCFFAGANSVFCGEKLLTTENAPIDEDDTFFQNLGLSKAPICNSH